MTLVDSLANDRLPGKGGYCTLGGINWIGFENGGESREMRDDEEIKKQSAYVLGESLDAKSVDELEENIQMLLEEIKRVEAEILKKTLSKNLAQDVFKT